MQGAMRATKDTTSSTRTNYSFSLPTHRPRHRPAHSVRRGTPHPYHPVARLCPDAVSGVGWVVGGGGVGVRGRRIRHHIFFKFLSSPWLLPDLP